MDMSQTTSIKQLAGSIFIPTGSQKDKGRTKVLTDYVQDDTIFI
jgi:hypothetical protein